MPEVNFGLLDTQLPGRIAMIPQEIQQGQMRNALQMMQLQHAGNQNALAQYQINAAKRQDEEQALYRNALVGMDISSPAGRAEAIRRATAINPSLGFGLAEQFQKREKGEADLAHVREQTGKLRAEQVQRQREQLHEAFRSGALNPTDEAIARVVNQAMTLGMPMQEATALQAELMALDPATRSMRLASFGAKAADLMKQVAPEIKQIQTPGGGLDFMQMNPNLPTFGQRPQGVQAMPAAMTPYEAARLPLEQQRVGLEGQRVGLERERINDAKNPNVVSSTITDNAGNVTLLNKYGQPVAPAAPIKGKPSATFEKTEQHKKQITQDLNLAITEIEKAIAPGGLLDKATASGAGKLVDYAGNFVGYGTKGAVAAADLKPIADLALKMVPRFEGPQSDKDTASYKEAAGRLGDESLPRNVRKSAAETIVRLMKTRRNQFTSQDAVKEGVAATSGVDTSNPLLKP